MKDASSLKPEIVSGLDILIVRELTGGVYFGEPKETTTLPDGQKRAVDTQVYTTSEIARIARVAFELARLRGNRVASAEKSNVMVTGVLWREVVTKIHKDEFPDVQLSHVLADNCAMQLVRNPKQFDVIVTDNLFGDVLSDEAAQLPVPSACCRPPRWARKSSASRRRSMSPSMAVRRISPARPGQSHRLHSLARDVPALSLRPGGRRDAARKRGRTVLTDGFEPVTSCSPE